MTVDTRRKNVNWRLPVGPDGRMETWEAVQVAVLMDIRDELQAIRGRLDCTETLGIPRVLRSIRRVLGERLPK